ncbi:MAG: TonB-dependent receptor [Sphingobacteriales bacterium]|nr:TonB-dependent receptor [Sphingobacteriales bacterium]
MRKTALLFALLNMSALAYAQTDSTREKTLEEAVVYSNKFAEKKKNLAQKIDVITAAVIARYNSQNTGDLLINTGNVFVQKSQQGGSSPVLRGFEASRILLIIDGVRMNNAIYRAGHLQNVITVDQNLLERAEVMYGPSSTIHGSDALGGAVQFRTKAPILSGKDKTLFKGSAFARYSTANREKTAHADLSTGGQKLAWLQSYSYSEFGDTRMGSKYPDKYPDFGRRSYYIETVNGIDNVVPNKDDRVQRFSGYSQWDIIQKFLLRQNDKVSHKLNLQYSGSTDIPRYDRLQDTRNFGGSTGTTLRYAEWYYGPQIRMMGSYELNVSGAGFLDELKAILSYQDIKESRQQREYRRYDRFDSRKEQIRVVGFTIDGRMVRGRNEISLGLDGQLNDLASAASRTNLNTGAVSPLDSRYPNGDNNMNYLGAYAQHLLKSKNGKIVLNDGIRLQTVHLHSTIRDNSFFNFPFSEISQHPFALTGNVGLVYIPTEEFRFTSSLSSGFRAPNIDDASRVFESSSASRRLILPNPGIRPEYTYNFDLGLLYNVKNIIHFELTGYYTLFRNAIALAPFRLNGQDSILYNGVQSAVYANQNMNKAFVRGLNARLKIEFSKTLSWDNTISQTYGRYILAGKNKIPLDHVPPVFGKSSLALAAKKLNTEVFMLFNGWKRIKDYNPNGEDNGQYATTDGMPSWFTLNWRGSYTIKKYLTVQAAVENIFDRNYRYFASGFSAPGRNFILALRTSF